MRRRTGKGSTSDWQYRKNRATILADSDLCWLCGHPGAHTADHVVPYKLWPRDAYGELLPGFNDVANLRPAHGTMGSRLINPCPICGKLCNQVRKTRKVISPHSRAW